MITTLKLNPQLFLTQCLPPATAAGEKYGIYPVVLVAHAALESGWGTSILSRYYHNYAGLYSYGPPPSPYWDGKSIRLGPDPLLFRVYETTEQCFMDYAHLLRSAYPAAADKSHRPGAFAREIAFKTTLSEVYAGNPEAYINCFANLITEIARRACNTPESFGLSLQH